MLLLAALGVALLAPLKLSASVVKPVLVIVTVPLAVLSSAAPSLTV